MARRRVSSTVFVTVAALMLGAGLEACRQEPDMAAPNPGKPPVDTTDALVLFTGTSAVSDSQTWSFESGMAKTAQGTLNPKLFLNGKNPFMTKGATLVLNLFEQTRFVAVVESSQILAPGRYWATGYIQGLPGSEFSAICESTTLSALVTIPETGVFRVEYAGDGKYRAVLQNGFTPSCPPVPKMKLLPDTSASPPPLRKTAAGPVVVDIAVLYTPAAMTGARSAAAMNSLADAAVAQANLAFRNSQTNVSLNLVYRGLIAYAESGVIATDLERLQDPADAFLNDAHSIRDAYGADLVTLITETGEPQYAGLGYVMQNVNAGFAGYGFNVVRRAYASGYSVLAHEVGHNMGCMHDAANSSNAGAYGYSFGHRWNGANGVQYRDLMAYAPGTLVNMFSNPSLAYKGALTGVAGSANTALTISNTGPTVEAFRVKLPLSVALTSPADGAVLDGPANVILNATPGGSNTVSKIQFFNGDTLLGEDGRTPFTWIWNPVPAGRYTLTAKVFNKDGSTATSAPVSLQVNGGFIYGTMNNYFVGTAGVPGTVDLLPGTDPQFTITATGMGLAGKSDNIQFLYQSAGAEFSLKSGVTSMGNANPGAVAGLLVRESLEPGARCVFFGRTAAGQVVVMSRKSLNGSLSIIRPNLPVLPYALYLIRKGDEFTLYQGPDRRNVIFVSTVKVPMAAAVLAGLGAGSNSTTVPNTAVFGWLDYGFTNHPAQVILSTPVPGSHFNPGKLLHFPATVLDRDGAATTRRVELYNDTAWDPQLDGTAAIGEDATAPYSIPWITTPGIAHIKAHVVEESHHSSYSNYLVFTVVGAGKWVSNPAADTHVRDGGSAGKNFSAASNIMVRNNATLGNTYQGHLKFPIDSMASIAGAKLRLYGKVLGGAETVSVTVLPVDSTAWLINGRPGITWNTMNAVGAPIATVVLPGGNAAEQWVEFDVTAHVQARKAAGASLVGFALHGTAPTDAYASFNSVDAQIGIPELILSGP